MNEVILEAKTISKRFPGVVALDKVDFINVKGEIHSLVGENGAGKSTLMKIIAGAYKPDEGTVIYEGNEVSWISPHHSQEAGISVIYQEFNLFPELEVCENIYMGNEPLKEFRIVDHKKMENGSEEALDKLGVHLDPNRKVKELSVAEQQMVEIARAMVNQTKLLILDEPTAVLSEKEADILFEQLRILKGEGVSIIYISHRLGEIFEISDRVTVLKDGRLVDTMETSSVGWNKVVSMMVGRDLKDIYPEKGRKRGKMLLNVENLKVNSTVKGVDLSLHEGEILGLAGLVGSGRTALAHGIFGSLQVTDGSCTISGGCLPEPVTYRSSSPRESIDRGIGFLTEDRNQEGLVLGHSVLSNITMPTLADFVGKLKFIDFDEEKKAGSKEVEKYAIAVPSLGVNVNNLSGGNQQKVLFARWVRACEGILILDEPTRGVDVGAKVEIYRIIRELANEGVAILMISSELPEIVGMCDRVIVMREGWVTGELTGEEITEEAIMHMATMMSREEIIKNGNNNRET